MKKNREQLIMENEDTVINLVKKYMHHSQDYDDLYQTGMMKVIECIDDCFESGDFSNHKAMCNIYARNGILKVVYKRKERSIDDFYLDNMGKCDDMLPFYVRETLAGKTRLFFDLILDGLSREKICEVLDIKQSMFYVYRQQIRDAIVKCGE